MRHVLHGVLIGTALALVGGAVFAAAVVPAPTDAAEDSYRAYVRDRSELLGRSNNADALLAAALMPEAYPKASDAEKAQRFTELLTRAEKAAPRDPLVWWVAATQCRGQPDNCADAQRDARAKLIEFDPHNAVTWLVESAAARNAGDADAAERAFASAAAAAHYDDHTVTSTERLAAQLMAHPSASAGVLGTRDEEVAYVHAASMAAALVLPSMGVPLIFCTPNHKPVQDEARVQQCLELADTMQRGDSLVAVSIGLRLEQALLEGKPEEASVLRRRRSFDWMVEQGSKLVAGMAGDSDAAQRYRRDLYASNSEIVAVAGLMKARGIALDPPADWRKPTR